MVSSEAPWTTIVWSACPLTFDGLALVVGEGLWPNNRSDWWKDIAEAMMKNSKLGRRLNMVALDGRRRRSGYGSRCSARPAPGSIVAAFKSGGRKASHVPIAQNIHFIKSTKRLK